MIKSIRRIFFLFLGMILASSITNEVNAQRFVYIDTEYILSKLPEYKAAQKQLDVLAENWAKDLEKYQQEIDKMYRTLQAEVVLLTDEMKTQREKDIRLKEQELNDLRNKRFGYEGELFQKRKDLIKPIQDRIFDAVQKLAKEKSYDFIFDKGNELLMLYASSKYDKSEEILQTISTLNTTTDKKK